MKLLERIVVHVDFGPRTDDVVAMSAFLAGKFRSKIHLLHVLPCPEPAAPEFKEIMVMAREEATRRLDQLRIRLSEAGAADVEVHLAEGTPFDRIAGVADELDANLIVVGSEKWDKGERARLGTTAERLCRRSSRPVWVVASGNSGAPTTILCPVDCSPPSRRALRNAIHMARRFNARLCVLHVVRSLSGFSGLIPGVQSGMEQKHVESGRYRFDSFLAEFDFHGVDWERLVRQGEPADVIVGTSFEVAAELLIMGSVGRTGLSRILLGSVAGKVARALPCSVVMVKAEDAIRLRLDEELTDLGTHYARGRELLENGFPNEAEREFRHCIRTSDMFALAWKGLAEIAKRRGDARRAEDFTKTAQRIEETLQWRRVEADIRRHTPLCKKS